MESFSFYLVVLLLIPSAVRLEVPRYLQAKYGNNVTGASPSPRYNPGVKTKTKSASAHGPSAHSGTRFRGGCNTAPPTPQNAGLHCSQYSGCRATCVPRYQFPNGATQLFINCNNGHWVIEGQIWQYVPSCQPICLPPCQNRGICIAPDQCQCPENYSGPICQFENKPCLSYPQLPTNSRRSCSHKTCTIACLHGHQFPDGSSITTMSCKDGYWLPDKEKWTSLPDCEPICDPPCQNGGNCLSFGRCQCPQDFRGPQCQYRTDNCDARKLQFNGGYNCSGDQVGLICSLSCPEGMTFETRPSSVYSCLYEEARFQPSPIPQCIFPVAAPVAPQAVSYKSSKSDYNLNTLSINGLPQGSYIPAGHRWDAYNHGMATKSFHRTDEAFITGSPYGELNNNVVFVQQKLPEPGICFTWQGTHYKTFDGRVYSFDSKCEHILVRDAIDKTFSIIVQNDPKCSNNPPNCHKIIRIYFDKKEYILKRSSEGIPIFGTPKKRLPIPGQFPGLRIEMSAHYIILSLDAVGSKLKWDGEQLVQVEVQESLWNRTEGLCGNINGDASDDLLNKDGYKPQTIANLATSWKVENLEKECNHLPLEEHACLDDEIDGSKNHEAMVFCKKLLNDQRFAPCHQVIDVSLLLDACRWDYCYCKNREPSVCACETMNVYVRACSYKGVKNLAAWRDEKTCPMQCTGGKVYKACGPAAGQPVCGASTEEEEDSGEGCVEGCYCPEGTVLHENRCITRDKCPCMLRTKIFPPGAEVPKECNTCTCSEGKWICTQVSCGARCAAIGDPHYITFDGRRFDFMGQCSYYLVKTPTFSIEAENVACAGAISQAMNLPSTVSSGLPSCTKTVTVKIFGQIIKLKQNHDVVVNGQDVSKIPYHVGNVTIRSISSIFLQVELPNGMLIWWDGETRAYVDIPANFKEKTRGLCGTFNNNQKDDFLTPENDVEQAIIPFANKWKTSEKCNDVPDVLKTHPCSSNIQNQPVAEKHCQKIKSDLFSSCHWIVDPEPYYQDCLYDMCSCEFKVSKCLCPTVAAYAEECSRQGVKISWRDSIRECGVHCPNGQKYQVCGNSCTRNCFDVATRPDCKPQCVEGCNCPEGESLNDDGECVPIGECNCHFDGLHFHAGYKEVRPASKGPELCTCINAGWSCHPATPDDQKKFPKASDLKSLCGHSANMEFTTCEPAEPVTCKNMHNLDYFSASVCHPGCKCKDNYVLDTSTKKCVTPSECPCHHGGKSYKENSIVQNDCNTCKCQNGKWTCTDRPCSAECSAWGDSHFKTFDDKHFDFQGQCDYALAKGSQGSDSFDVSIQNVPCGSLGTSCSKSVTIRVKSGDDQDMLTLTRDKPLPNFASMKHLTIRQKGLFVIVEAPDLGLVIQWDKGTRVYVKVDPRWKDRVKGLCGNYNDNDADDFQTPSGGITEASAKIFGDSWKLQSYCPEALEITNTCEDRPDRKVWALKQCGVLKSSLFSPCHSEVPVDIYLEKCVFDACACDQGGDCECLCTALAAYAQECTTRGVPIKWRSQKLCPMQCDERCSNYSPCISTCPTETCDNLLTHGQLSKTCKEETCIEGCVPKPCAPGHIYLNSSFLECVPRNICRPACLEIDGVTYYEGDLVEGDECYSCYCSRGQKVCKGQPCSTVQVVTTKAPTTHMLEQFVKCQSGWTQWINQDKANVLKTIFRKKKTDFEPLPTPLLLNNLEGAKCAKEKMVDIECRTVKTHIPAKGTGLDVECSLERGLVCKSSMKGKACQDFEIRVRCECEEMPTTPAPTCDPLIPHKEHPTNCTIFYHCEVGLDGPKYVEKSCGPTMYFNPISMVCDWPYAVEEIKPVCKGTSTTIQELPVEETKSRGDVAPVEAEFKYEPLCPPGTEENDCAIQCDRLCIYYFHVVREKGLCENEKKCERDCVEKGQSPTCPEGKMWANNHTCVDLSHCLCRSEDGKPIKPGTVYRESDCRICQCVDNFYSCDESACDSGEKEEARLLPSVLTGKKKKPKPVETGGFPSLEQPTTPEGLKGMVGPVMGRPGRPPGMVAPPGMPRPGRPPGMVGPAAGVVGMAGQPILLSTVTPPKKCDEDHFVDLIQGDQALPDVVFNASSVLSDAFRPSFAKFTPTADSQSEGSWSPQYTDNHQYLEIDLGQQEPIYGIKIKGSPVYDEYVTSYKVYYSPDAAGMFFPVLNKQNLPQIFRGSIDGKTPVEQIFDTPFEAQVVRINPQTWHTGIALRVELIGCGEPLTTTVLYEFITQKPLATVAPTVSMCEDPMGLDDGMMSDQQVSVSSELNHNHSKASLKLSDDNSWQPLTNSPTEFVQFDFLEPRNITGLEIKGGPNGWVTAFTLKYSQDNKAWNPILDKKTKKEQTFLGNYDADSPQLINFDLPINAKYVKLIPKKWHDNIQLRVEMHGCFEPYPTILEELTTIAPSPCNYCPGVTTEPLEMQACRCVKNKWWDGENCVNRTECPCLVGHISYPVGTSYKEEDCSECLCKIGGVSHCSPKQCDSCEKGLRSTVTSTCKCTCQPCPDGTTLCPTSDVCINSTLWCNGVQDCPDDEIGCPTTETPTKATTRTTTTTPTPPTAVTERIVKQCPVIECPPGFNTHVKKQTKGRLYQSSMFSSYSSKPTKSAYKPPEFKKGRSKRTPKKSVWQNPFYKHTKAGSQKKCTEFQCVSVKPPPIYMHSKKECPPASCPPGYIPVEDSEDYANKKCPKYACEPQPPPDAICNVTGRTFNTFDGTEYKYDICNHVLALDLENDEWEVSLRKNCSEVCWRDLIIHHQDNLIVLHPNLTMEYDGFPYTVEQTKKIASYSRAFTVSRLGNTVLFVSNRYGFWVIWDKEGNVKLGVTRKLEDKVAGLCGYFNENPDDDKKKPDGSLARTTSEFGNSWEQADQGQICEPQACPLHIQDKAWKICQVKEQALEPCTRVVNKDAFISRCIETTCDCLQAAAHNHTVAEECRCRALEDFVVQCLTSEPTTDVSDWRVQLDCPATCDAPLVYHDCYQRKCEPTCESLSSSDAACPKVPNVCFPGCYCPPGLVKKGDTCISPSNCGDCECNVLPHLQYVTYDDTNFTINANCVYVMSRDAVGEDKKHKFQVLITNAPCKNNAKKTCVGKVTILYQGRKIHIFTDMIRHKLKLIVNGEHIEDFSDVSSWARITETATKHLKIHLTDVQVDVSVYYPSLGTSIKAPSQKYGGKLEGLCGDCDHNPYDDLRTPSGAIINDTDEFALSWLYDKLPGGQSKEMCANKPEDCPPLPKKSDPCNLILDYKTFGQCLRVLDPSLFLEWCKKDTCGNHPELACTAIEAYARDCSNTGFCINWRTNVCPKTCPPDKIYNPCGTSCPKTCQSIKEKEEKDCPKIPVEGCFCPEGQLLRNDTCVVEKDCEVCDEEGHHPGDTWKKDKCTSCTCEGTSQKCETERCSGADKICEQGYQVMKVPSGEKECCDKYACVPEPTAGPTCETPQVITCGPGQITKLATKPNGCQQFICECKPVEECEPTDTPTEQPLKDGYVKTIDDSGCCPEVKIICKKELCPKPKPCQQYHTLKNETGTGECCPLYTCEPPKDKCIYENEYTAAETGGERARTEMEKQKVLKNANETWQDGPCRQCKCSITSVGNYQPTCSHSDCSAIEISQDYLDYELEPEFVYDKCCPNVKRVACKYNQKVYKVGKKWTKENDYCTIYECVNSTSGIQKETKVTKCDTDCDLGYKYVAASPGAKQCCGSCKPYACVVDGSIHKEGDAWESPDHCTKYFCLTINGSMQVQSQKVNCPELPKDYIDDFVFESVAIEGECCKEHRTTACKVEGKVYNVGETLPSPDGDKCKNITCGKNKNGEIIKQESIETCKTTCSKGWEYEESNETCCGKCVQVACVVKDELKKPDEKWMSPDNCTTYTCNSLGGELMVSSEQETCPSLEDCPEKNVYSKGCCKYCNITSAAQIKCGSEEIALNKTVGLVTAHRGEHGKCVNKKAIPSFKECIGICHSSTSFNAKKGAHESDCSCCQATRYVPLEVELECEDGFKWNKKIEVPSDCGCEGCAAPARSTKKATHVKT
jgi:von Willebrand factor